MDLPRDWEGIPASDLRPSGYFRWKGILDRVLAFVLLIPGLPIIGLLILLIRLTSRGPGVYCQTRVGKDGRIFMLKKIRTMRCDAEAATGPVWTGTNDDRITPVGHFLRRLHLDEFPQLFNVLNGDMSLIGPRPERPEFVEILFKTIPNYCDRIAVKPGVTGLAQINLDPDSDLESVRRKLVLDVEYIKHAGLFLDGRILLCTFMHLLGFRGDCAKRITRLHRDVPQLTAYAPSQEIDLTVKPAPSSSPPPLPLHLRPAHGNGNGHPTPHPPTETIPTAAEAPQDVEPARSTKPR